MIRNIGNGVAASTLSGDSYAAGTRGVIDEFQLDDVQTGAGGFDKSVIVYAGDYLNKLAGETIERECRQKISEGYKELVVNFSRTELVNSIGISILLGVIDAATSNGAKVVFSEVNESTAELFEVLGITKHVVIH